ncbi:MULTISPECIES: phosphoethanolamine transferase [Acinetobacter]|uniref:phosphoethanolamine transferase n=1 Tax=Acinetobacter TaxID=469 RepID=UPI0002D129F3|nr:MULTISPECIES: phosphoethanolamine transferase [Acinetobacter]ENX24933.1 hypothetical protein F893_00525 [Acinetobacter sp. CIP 102136]MCO8089561.1 lipid A phosphoethanolamine transferase [Acinetobacter indicus]
MFAFLIPDLYFLFKDWNFYFFFLSVFFLIYILSITKTTKYLFITLPILILIPLYIYYISIYHVSINEQVLSVVLETDFQEAWHFIGYKIYLYIFIFILWCIWCAYSVHRHYKKPLVWRHRSRWWFLIAGSIYVVFSYTINAEVANQIDQTFESQQDNFLVDEKNFFVQEVKRTYPLGFFISVYDLMKEQRKINSAFEQNKNFKFFAQQHIKTKQKQLYILVIGETSRRKNWQLNGYARPTNPKLSQQNNLVNFSDMLSISSATRSSIPMILTRKPAEHVYKFTFAEKSVISAFKEAGFKTYWLSTQQRFGSFDTSTSVYAKEADQIIFLNKANYTDAGEKDDVLIPVLDKIVQSNEQKQFIVIHTLGSHYNYLHRYPEEFNVFTPSLNSLAKYSLQDKKYKAELTNSYDNSLVFTDYVLNEFIEILKRQKNTASFLLYTSDHGEDLFDNGCDKSGHGLETKYNFEIASFAWYSDQFFKNYVDKVKILNENKDRKLNQTAIFPTLVDAANIAIPEYGKDRSILQRFQNYPRVVLGGKNYDTAKYEGMCKEIK